jgi:Spy/CpxP family protein refolding chaperone
MKSNLKILFAAAVLGVAALPLVSSAQEEKAPAPPREGGGGGGRQRATPEQMVARLDEAVTLTAEQKTKATEIYKKQSDAMAALSGEERREKGMEIMKATREQIRALLTEEQQKKFDAMPQRGPGGGGQRRQGGGGDAAK